MLCILDLCNAKDKLDYTQTSISIMYIFLSFKTIVGELGYVCTLLEARYEVDPPPQLNNLERCM
jgi:hypothetical protein